MKSVQLPDGTAVQVKEITPRMEEEIKKIQSLYLKTQTFRTYDKDGVYTERLADYILDEDKQRFSDAIRKVLNG